MFEKIKMKNIKNLMLLIFVLGCHSTPVTPISRSRSPETTMSQKLIIVTAQNTLLFCAGLQMTNIPRMASCYSKEEVCVLHNHMTNNHTQIVPCHNVESVYCFDYTEEYSSIIQVWCNFTILDCRTTARLQRRLGASTTECEMRTNVSRMH